MVKTNFRSLAVVMFDAMRIKGGQALSLLVFILVATCIADQSPPIGPPPIQCVQGNDDQVMSLHLLQNNQLSDLQLRYATIQQQQTPGNRRYNLFWSEFESSPPASAPIPCPAGTQLIPTNEVRYVVA